MNKWLVLKIIIISVCWFLSYKCYDHVKDLEEIKGFVPYEILGVMPDASLKDVKRAYRKLSREKHPDKNQDNPAAVNEFIQITKAYTIMTDPRARDNFAKYGNPDGPGNFHVSIALPQFLQHKDYHIFILVCFLLLVSVVIPYFFYINLFYEVKDIGGVS